MRVATKRSTLAFSLVVLASVICCGTLRAQSLRSVISSDVPADPRILANLDREISNNAILNDAKWFAVAYYLQGNSDLLEGPLFVDRYDRSTGQWRSASLAPEKIQAGLSDCRGSAQSFKEIGDSFVLETHVGANGSCMLILSTDLQVRGALYGSPLVSFPDGSIVFLQGEKSYGPVHAAEIGFFNRKTGHSYTLFPRKPYGPVRQAVIAKLSEFFDAHLEWCNQHNSPCDPENPDSELSGQVAVNDLTDSAAFVIDYGGDPFDVNSPPVPGARARAVYIFRNLHNEYGLQYREMLQSDVTSRVGNVALPQLLTPANLKGIFGN